MVFFLKKTKVQASTESHECHGKAYSSPSNKTGKNPSLLYLVEVVGALGKKMKKVENHTAPQNSNEIPKFID